MFYKQVVLQQGLPFEVKLNAHLPIDASALTRDELDEELERGYRSVRSGDVKPAGEVFGRLHKEFDI